MQVKINGEKKTVEDNISIDEIVRTNGLDPAHIVVEHNLHVVPAEKWESTFLLEDDVVELIRFVGGGA